MLYLIRAVELSIMVEIASAALGEFGIKILYSTVLLLRKLCINIEFNSKMNIQLNMSVNCHIRQTRRTR